MKINFIQKMKEKTRTFFVALKEKIRGYYKGHGYTCDACGGEVFDYPTHRFCVNCEGKLFQNVGKICPKCGRRTLAAGVCLACKSHTPSFTFGYSPFVYRAETAALVNRMKNGAPVLSFYFSEKMAEYFKSIDMPTSLADFGLDKTCIERLSELCTFGKQRTVKSYIDMDFEVIKDIFKLCL